MANKFSTSLLALSNTYRCADEVRAMIAVKLDYAEARAKLTAPEAGVGTRQGAAGARNKEPSRVQVGRRSNAAHPVNAVGEQPVSIESTQDSERR